MQESLFPTSAPVPFVTRVTLRNYRSIEQCDVVLRPLTVLVGRNGAGKSNFLDALRFLTEALQHSLQQAFNSRGGIAAVRRKSTGHPRNFAMRFELALPAGRSAIYRFAVAARRLGGFVVRREEAIIREGNGSPLASYRIVRTGKGDDLKTLFEASVSPAPPAQDDRLYLPIAAGFPAFRELFDGLAAMGFYSLNPEEMRRLQTPEHGELLARDGRNLPSVIARLQQEEPAALQRIEEYLATIVPGVRKVERITHGGYETLQFSQAVKGASHPWTFEALNMSDGTLRALGILVAAVQLFGRKRPVRLVGIEEAETALHPAAAGALVDALREASAHTQVVLTSHSPEILDRLLNRRGHPPRRPCFG
ncbi:AAA family ATPase [Nannocystis pusilla]|uniref:AAA family ATPase n=1 Tax=Nannocystis pusilla TaxID=889268 RepID=A0A9X3EUX4_9BACT|nr:AAA family ATPase [Nannocystis pusilla]MCY1010757.1 AAA family ATPase [Nannocystis pusilla]